MADWAGLLPDLLVQIAKRIHLVEDFMAFRGVCTSWRAATVNNHTIFNSWPAVPLLMLAETENSDDREFYSLSRGMVCMRLPLPEAKWKKCMEAGYGWFLTVDLVEELELFHPFSRRRIRLPPQYSFPRTLNPFMSIEIGVLSASPSHTMDFVLMVIYSSGSALGFWRPGDKSWTSIKATTFRFSDVNYYNGKFYLISFDGHIWVWDVLSPDVLESLFCVNRELIHTCKSYLVESAGELLVVVRNGIHDYNYGATYFEVIRLNLVKREWSMVTNLGNRSIFLGHNAAFSIDVTGNLIRPNCIYFSDDSIEAYGDNRLFWPKGFSDDRDEFEIGGGKDMGVYNLADRKIERFDNVESYSLVCPPVWIVLCY